MTGAFLAGLAIGVFIGATLGVLIMAWSWRPAPPMTCGRG